MSASLAGTDPGSEILCYCFSHTRTAIESEVERTGQSGILEEILREVRRGNCSCATLNPAGRCCLREVRCAAEAARQETTDEKRELG